MSATESAVQIFARSAKVATEAPVEISTPVVEALRGIRERAANLFLESTSSCLGLEQADLEAGLKLLSEEEGSVLAGVDKSAVIRELYAELDPEILQLRDEKFGMPRLIPVRLSERESSIRLEISNSRVGATYSSAFTRHEVVKDRYVTKALAETMLGLAFSKARQRTNGEYDLPCSTTFAYKFTGVVPAEAKRAVMAARFDFGNNMLLFFEPKVGPDISVVMAPADPDPVIVGIHDSRLFLITDFETTGVETLFAATPPGMGQLLR